MRLGTILEPTVERGDGEIVALGNRGPEFVKTDEIRSTQIDGGLGAVRGDLPRGTQKFAVCFAQALGPSTNLLGRQHNHRGRAIEIIRQRHNAFHQCRQQRFHARHGDALGNGVRHRPQRRHCVAQQFRAVANVGGQRNFAHRQALNPRNRQQRPLIGDRKFTHVVDFVAKEIHANRVVCQRREDIQNSTTHRNLATAGHHVDTLIPGLEQAAGRPQQVGTTAHRQSDGAGIRQVCGQRLQRGAHAGNHHQARNSVPRVQFTQHRKTCAHRLARRAQTFVRQRLPGREDHGANTPGAQ